MASTQVQVHLAPELIVEQRDTHFQGFGRSEMPDVLVQWATGFGVLHALSPVLAPAVSGSELVGIKFFFGSNAGQDTAEVRIASVADPLGSAALMQLP